MKPDRHAPNPEAATLLRHPILIEALERIENAATEQVIMSSSAEAREPFVWKVRAVRALRRDLKTLAEGKPLPKRNAVA